MIAFGVGEHNTFMHDSAHAQPVWVPCKFHDFENAIKGINWNDLLSYTDVEAES